MRVESRMDMVNISGQMDHSSKDTSSKDILFLFDLSNGLLKLIMIGLDSEKVMELGNEVLVIQIRMRVSM